LEHALELRGIRKTYPGVVAVGGVDLTLDAGEIHALVGENGAGKSTLANIAFGEIHADEGTIRSNGSVGLVHQHFELVGRLTVWQNIVLGREPRNGVQLDERAARQRVIDLAAKNGLEIDPDACVEDLPIGIQQRVELLRELEREPTVLLLDEPTAALAPAEIDSFFTTVEALAKRGTAVMIVTHKLHEVISHSTRVTVMRHGKIVSEVLTADTTADEIAKAMVGGNLPDIASRVKTELKPCVRLESVSAGSGSGAVDGVSFEVHAGEIVGIAGVEGNGQTALADAIAGMLPYRGTITRPTKVGVIPQDRHREALVMSWSIVDNTVFGRQHDPGIARGPLLDHRRARADAELIRERFDLRAANLDVAVKTLSGGNQQKVVVGRALIDDPQLVIAYNPTRGIDVGAAALVQSRLVEARNAGAAILLISFELDEILSLSDRILVMFRGAVVGNFERENIDRARIGALMAGSAA
jgi:simple sugar transport system ATP-binding protein